MVLIVKRRNFLIPLFILGILATSCVNTRQATYFSNSNDGTITTKTPVPDSKIRQNDLLSISVSSLNPEASAPFNTPNSSSINGGGQNMAIGYLVDPEGNIQFPFLGNIKAAGMSKEQLKAEITKSLIAKQLLTDPIVTVRFLNFRVTVLGEVKNPTVITEPSEKISLLEAIGLAGDLTLYARRDNVLIIREEDGVKNLKRLNLNSDELLSSPYYYLKANDIVYVEPNKARVASTGRGQQWVPTVLSGLSLTAIILDRIFR